MDKHLAAIVTVICVSLQIQMLGCSSHRELAQEEIELAESQFRNKQWRVGRQHLDLAQAEIEDSDEYLSKTSCFDDACSRRGLTSGDFTLWTQAEIVKAWSFLVPPFPEHREALRAKEHFDRAVTKLQEDSKASTQEIADTIDAQQTTAMVMAVVGAIATAGLSAAAYQGAVAPSIAQMGINLSSQFSNQMMQAVQIGDGYRVAEATWGDDGIRMLLLPFSKTSDILGHYTAADSLYLLIAGDNRCTAAAVGPRLALTNAHCVLDDNGRQFDKVILARERFDLSRNRWTWESFFDEQAGKWDTAINVKRIHLPPNAELHDSKAYFNRDWALLETNATFPMWFGSEVTRYGSSSKDIAIAGYSGDLNNGRFLTMDWGCLYSNRGGGLLGTSCKSWKGASGAPVLWIGAEGYPTVVGVHSRGYHEISTSAVAVDASEFIDAIKAVRSKQEKEAE